MVSERSDRIPVALKILIAGGFGAGKTTMVGSVSEIRPLQTEEVLTGAEGADELVVHRVTPGAEIPLRSRGGTHSLGGVPLRRRR